jgi:hypothetical protein
MDGGGAVPDDCPVFLSLEHPATAPKQIPVSKNSQAKWRIKISLDKI